MVICDELSPSPGSHGEDAAAFVATLLPGAPHATAGVPLQRYTKYVRLMFRLGSVEDGSCGRAPLRGPTWNPCAHERAGHPSIVPASRFAFQCIGIPNNAVRRYRFARCSAPAMPPHLSMMSPETANADDYTLKRSTRPTSSSTSARMSCARSSLRWPTRPRTPDTPRRVDSPPIPRLAAPPGNCPVSHRTSGRMKRRS